jgi:uncharacterized protein (DUF1786 family)
MEKSEKQRILALDIGGGTQDILLYEEGKEPENFTRLVLPSPTSIVANKIREASKNGFGIHLSGTLMGGGPNVRALREHLQAGLPVTAEEAAARTIRDDLNEARQMGIKLTDTPPENFERIEMKDLDLQALENALKPFHVKLPGYIAVAVQDHGEAPAGVSNRYFRFLHWKGFLQNGGNILDLAYSSPPPYLTRMKAAQQTSAADLIMDTCSAAVWGALEDEAVQEELPRGLVLINVGNKHTFAVLLKEQSICGLFEHHTRYMNPEKLNRFIKKLQLGKLTHEEIFSDGGHGCFIADHNPDGFSFIGVTGPRRSMARGLGYHQVNPHGDMMLTGCYGLVRAVKKRA